MDLMSTALALVNYARALTRHRRIASETTFHGMTLSNGPALSNLREMVAGPPTASGRRLQRRRWRLAGMVRHRRPHRVLRRALSLRRLAVTAQRTGGRIVTPPGKSAWNYRSGGSSLQG